MIFKHEKKTIDGGDKLEAKAEDDGKILSDRRCKGFDLKRVGENVH